MQHVNHSWRADHCELDMRLVDLGRRPWITAITDEYSRCIVGYSLGIVGPSAQSVADALYFSHRPKDEIVAQHGAIKGVWKCQGRPLSLSVSGRDCRGDVLLEAAAVLGIDIRFSPHRKAWFSGKIEKWIRNTTTKTMSEPAGAILRLPSSQQSDSGSELIVTMRHVHWIVTKWIVDVHHETLSLAMRDTPAQRWTKGLAGIL